MKTIRSPRLFFAAVLVLQLLSVRPVLAQAAPTSVASLRQQDPYRHVGLLSFFSGREEYIGSATVIKPRSLLTAGHNLYSTGTGWSTQVVFERSYHNGSRASRSMASGLFVLGGYASLVDRGRSETNQGFSRDLGGVVCFSRPQGGLHAAWQQNRRLLTGRSYKMSLGYGAMVHSGEELLRSSPTKAFYQVAGSFYENRSYGIEGGMSGGPVFTKSGGKWYVCAVNVSGPAGRVFNKGAGVRVIDKDAATLIGRDLK